MKRTLCIATIGTLVAFAFGAPAANGELANLDEAECGAPGLLFLSGDGLGAPQNDGVVAPGNNNCGPKNCDAWYVASWEVEGEYAEGSGRVEFGQDCGDTNLLKCEVSQAGIDCAVGPKDPIDGPVVCWHRDLDGLAKKIVGKCVDPVNPHHFIPSVDIKLLKAH